jgi:hypothetical protein
MHWMVSGANRGLSSLVLRELRELNILLSGVSVCKPHPVFHLSVEGRKLSISCNSEGLRLGLSDPPGSPNTCSQDVGSGGQMLSYPQIQCSVSTSTFRWWDLFATFYLPCRVSPQITIFAARAPCHFSMSDPLLAHDLLLWTSPTKTEWQSVPRFLAP